MSAPTMEESKIKRRRTRLACLPLNYLFCIERSDRNIAQSTPKQAARCANNDT